MVPLIDEMCLARRAGPQVIGLPHRHDQRGEMNLIPMHVIEPVSRDLRGAFPVSRMAVKSRL